MCKFAREFSRSFRWLVVGLWPRHSVTAAKRRVVVILNVSVLHIPLLVPSKAFLLCHSMLNANKRISTTSEQKSARPTKGQSFMKAAIHCHWGCWLVDSRRFGIELDNAAADPCPSSLGNSHWNTIIKWWRPIWRRMQLLTGHYNNILSVDRRVWAGEWWVDISGSRIGCIIMIMWDWLVIIISKAGNEVIKGV